MRYINDEIKKISNRNKKIKLIFKVIIYIIILPITIYNTYLLIMSYFKPNEIPSFFGIKSYEVISESMQPTLKIGDVVIIKNDIDKINFKIGDIISYRKGKAVITHRIVAFENDKYITKGEYNSFNDEEKVKFEEIEGKVIFKIPFLGKIFFFLSNKVVILLITILLYLMYIYIIKTQIKKKVRRKKRENNI